MAKKNTSVTQPKMAGTNITLLVLSFVEGAAVMMTELLGAKIMAPYFGTSLYVWSSTLGVSLGALALGYYFGGYISKKYPRPISLFYILNLASLLTVAIPFWASMVLGFTEPLNVRLGSLLSLLLYLLPPMMLMAMTSPMIIQLLNRNVGSAGQVSGKIYAISTVGGIGATLFAGLYLIPFMGIKNTALFTGIILWTSVCIYYVMQRKSPASTIEQGFKKKPTRQSVKKVKSALSIAMPILLMISFIEGGCVMVIEIIGAKILGIVSGIGKK